MPLLILMRHAKSDWDADFDSDHERPLAARGTSAAKAMGRVLGDSGVDPDVIISSTAVRARSTMALVREAAGWNADPQLEPDLYGASVNDVFHLASGLSDTAQSAIFFGHQPTFGAAVSHLTGGSTIRFPTAAAAAIEVSSWRAVSSHAGELQWLLIPRMFPKS